ncbi:hypothetical protein D9613_010896 [Agrocybe pediades]|uniref:Uncharacterized protein n=1 Tax=Agrocybe pediades TaxID=84607 RepID=A0A8H4QLP3_9AGAR|nr:hypothetical protein D9613_010896 [Agrocybe pediades]
MIRPPPLQLKLDNRFPHPVRTPSVPKETFVSQLYKASWKNPIIAEEERLSSIHPAIDVFILDAFLLVSTVYDLHMLLYYNAGQDAIVDRREGAENLHKVSIALCVMYAIALVIEIYGIIGVSMQRLKLIRAYLYLTLFGSFLITVAGTLKGVSYFIFAEDLMYECVSLATEGRTFEKSLFRGHIWPGTVFAVSKRFARKHCLSAWVHHSWSEVASVFLFSLAPAVIYYILVHTYQRQTIDPNHHANLLHQRDEQQRERPAGRRGAGGSRPQYSQVGYSRVGSNMEEVQSTGMTSSRLHAANPSARLRANRSHVQAGRSVRGVGGASAASTSSSSTATGGKRTYTYRNLQRPHRPPPLLQSPSPLGLNHPPPNYEYQHGQRHNTNRVYAAFAAPVDEGEYDKFV